jgi:hypothetical protein
MLVVLDKAFFVLHTVLVVFNMFGWIARRTRVAHAIALGATLFSWFVLGIAHGWGYCICADWHFQVRRKLGYVDTETSYIQLMSREFFGVSMTRSFADWLAVIVVVGIVVATCVVWYRDRVRRQDDETN